MSRRSGECKSDTKNAKKECRFRPNVYKPVFVSSGFGPGAAPAPGLGGRMTGRGAVALHGPVEGRLALAGRIFGGRAVPDGGPRRGWSFLKGGLDRPALCAQQKSNDVLFKHVSLSQWQCVSLSLLAATNGGNGRRVGERGSGALGNANAHNAHPSSVVQITKAIPLTYGLVVLTLRISAITLATKFGMNFLWHYFNPFSRSAPFWRQTPTSEVRRGPRRASTGRHFGATRADEGLDWLALWRAKDLDWLEL